MKKYLVIGNPIDHSLSPKLHNHWIKENNINAVYDKKISLDAEELVPTVTWGTSPEDTAPINGKVPDPKNFKDEALRSKIERSIAYMDLKPGQKITDIKIDRIIIKFILKVLVLLNILINYFLDSEFCHKRFQ